MREGIIQSLQPFFVAEDAFSGVLMQTIKRMLRRADVVDLTNVLLSADNFINEMRPYLDEYRQLQYQLFNEAQGAVADSEAEQADVSGDDNQTDIGRNDPNGGGGSNGPGNTGGENTVREINSLDVHHSDIHQTVQIAGASTDNRHETPLAGGPSSNGSIPGEALS